MQWRCGKSFGELYVYLLFCRHFRSYPELLRLHTEAQPAPRWYFSSFPYSDLDVNMLPDGWLDETLRPPGLLRALKIEHVDMVSQPNSMLSLYLQTRPDSLPSNEEGPDYRVNNSYWVQFSPDRGGAVGKGPQFHTQSFLLQSLTTAEPSSMQLHMSYCFIKGHTCSSFHSAQASPACSFWDAPLIILRCSSHWSPSWLLIALANASSSLRW